MRLTQSRRFPAQLPGKTPQACRPSRRPLVSTTFASQTFCFALHARVNLRMRAALKVDVTCTIFQDVKDYYDWLAGPRPQIYSYRERAQRIYIPD